MPEQCKMGFERCGKCWKVVNTWVGHGMNPLEGTKKSKSTVRWVGKGVKHCKVGWVVSWKGCEHLEVGWEGRVNT